MKLPYSQEKLVVDVVDVVHDVDGADTEDHVTGVPPVKVDNTDSILC